MKKVYMLLVCLILLISTIINAQNTFVNKYLEVGINFSTPAHDDLLLTHSHAIGFSIRKVKVITMKLALGIRAEYEYRFAKKYDKNSIIPKNASNRGFSLFSIKPNIQFNLRNQWFWGAETGLGYVISDYNNKIGLGFIEEYDGCTQFGSCSGLYIGKFISMRSSKTPLNLSLYWSNFFSENHAENFVGLRFNYLIKT
jgi:hypothetical protein